MGKKLMIWGVAMAAFLGFAPGANGETVSVLLYNGSYPEGTSFVTCSGGGNVIAETRGYDSSGALQCFIRQGVSNVWKTGTGCVGAATFRVFLKRAGFDYCISNSTPWNGAAYCSYDGTDIKAVGYQCGAGTLIAVGKTGP